MSFYRAVPPPEYLILGDWVQNRRNTSGTKNRNQTAKKTAFKKAAALACYLFQVDPAKYGGANYNGPHFDIRVKPGQRPLVVEARPKPQSSAGASHVQDIHRLQHSVKLFGYGVLGNS